MKCTLGKPKAGRPWRMMVINMTLMSYCYAVQIFLIWRTGRLWWMDHVRARFIDNKGKTVDVLSPEAVFRRWTENRAWRALRTCLFGVWYFLASEVETMLGLSAYFGFGVYSLVDDRSRTCGTRKTGWSSASWHSKEIEESDAKELDSCPSKGP
ncbi:hypothetical protein CDEST_09569 [Colletotrichum destructivum]|uniref:Uncharacterized protein n=1 Tax=Colletotrichum destructivum TaxID=34406 RepID=A0AAX4INL5_9PEZI|nr:hypothetical protein CDEST_09569 [Colletotrichum destructivum]